MAVTVSLDYNSIDFESDYKTSYQNIVYTEFYHLQIRRHVKLKYLVICINRDKSKEERKFNTCREALCFATNYSKIKFSEVYKGKQLIQKFKY